MNPSSVLKDFALRRREGVVTTWRFRLVAGACAGLLAWGTRAFWIPQAGNALICAEDRRASDLIVVDNSNQNYHPFERAAELRRFGVASAVVVPATASGRNPEVADMVAEGIVGVMARAARLSEFDVLPVTETEPITLNVAYQVADYATKRQVRSITVAVPAFRSRRTMLVYHTVMGPLGVTVRCVPAFGRTNVATWANSWHGIQDVGEQFAKLQYYRFWVLPFVDGPSQSSRGNMTTRD